MRSSFRVIPCPATSRTSTASSVSPTVARPSGKPRAEAWRFLVEKFHSEQDEIRIEEAGAPFNDFTNDIIIQLHRDIGGEGGVPQDSLPAGSDESLSETPA